MRSVRTRRRAVTLYAAELMQNPALILANLPKEPGTHVLTGLSSTRDGVALTVWGTRWHPERFDVVVSAERSGPLYSVVRDGFVMWSDGRVTAADQRWYENTD